MGRNIEEFELLNTASQLRRAGEHAFAFYRGAIPADECHRVVQESYDLLAENAAIRHHLVPLAERWTLDRLRRVGTLDKRLARSVPEVLFVDAHDTGAAPLAAALLAFYARGRVNVSSAGQQPGPALDPMVAQALADNGIETRDHFAKPVTADAVDAADVIVTFGVPLENLQENPEQRRLSWDVPSPDGEPYDTAAAARDDLDRRVLRLLADLLYGPAKPS
ncbi:MAG TPA: hypothetical protein VF062_00420 [Candidatus Limnocylindrales bacterium]